MTVFSECLYMRGLLHERANFKFQESSTLLRDVGYVVLLELQEVSFLQKSQINLWIINFIHFCFSFGPWGTPTWLSGEECNVCLMWGWSSKYFEKDLPSPYFAWMYSFIWSSPKPRTFTHLINECHTCEVISGRDEITTVDCCALINENITLVLS